MYQDILVSTKDEIENILSNYEKEIRLSGYAMHKAYPSKPPKDKPSIYVACLASYNAGMLYGYWIDCTLGYSAVMECIQDMIGDSPEPDAADWAIHDYEGFGSYRVEEYDDIRELCDIAEVLDNENGELIVAVKDYLGGDTTLDDAKEFIENNYRGVHKDLGEYAYDLCESCGDLDAIPKHIVYHIDFDAMGRDWDYLGEIFTITLNGYMHVFAQ